MESVNRSAKVDVGYGATPEAALLAVLQCQPAFEPHDAEYPDTKPDFMDVDVKWIDAHDWQAYRSPADAPSHPDRGDGPIVQIKRPYDLPSGDKVRIILSNVWVDVIRPVAGEEKRADVLFRFTIDLDERQWTGDYRVTGEMDKTWKCERMSTEPK